MTKTERAAILARVDHTCLSPTATWREICQLCDEGLCYQTASVCLPPAYVAQAATYLAGRLPICTVVGFPLGYSTTMTKVGEAREAVASGADEVDMVIRLGWLKEGNVQAVEDEIHAVKAACGGKILKVIVETCCLTESEIAMLPAVVARAGADFIKTSTGFSRSGATPHDVKLLAANRPAGLKIKAAGGITSFADAAEFLHLGADRLGTSRLVRLAMEEDQSEQKGEI